MQQRRISTRKPRKRLLALSGSALKWIGLGCTVLGIFGMAVLQRGLLRLDGYTNASLYEALQPGSATFGIAGAAVACTLLSALGLPVYAKLLYEGWRHTSSIKRYLLRLALCALVSEIPYDLAYRGVWFDPTAQNPLWGMFLAVLMLALIKRYARPGVVGVGLKAAFIAAAAVWAVLLQSQLGVMFVLLAALFYCFEGSEVSVMLGGIALTVLQFPAPFGMVFVYWYNGQKGKAPRRFFYAAYPVLLLVFALVGRLAAGL